MCLIIVVRSKPLCNLPPTVRALPHLRRALLMMKTILSYHADLCRSHFQASLSLSQLLVRIVVTTFTFPIIMILINCTFMHVTFTFTTPGLHGCHHFHFPHLTARNMAAWLEQHLNLLVHANLHCFIGIPYVFVDMSQICTVYLHG